MHILEDDNHEVVDLHISRGELGLIHQICKICLEDNIYKKFPDRPTEADIGALYNIIGKILASKSGWKKCDCHNR